jgi:DNA-binding HxlR family transcriptional regulator
MLVAIKNDCLEFELVPDKQYLCPVEALVDVIGGKWKIPIYSLLFKGTKRYGELREQLPGITERMLTMQLRELEQAGIVQRKAYAEVPPKVEYSLSELGVSLEPVLQVMLDWSANYLRTMQKEATWWEKINH